MKRMIERLELTEYTPPVKGRFLHANISLKKLVAARDDIRDEVDKMLDSLDNLQRDSDKVKRNLLSVKGAKKALEKFEAALDSLDMLSSEMEELGVAASNTQKWGMKRESMNESMSRYCAFYKARDKQWYMDLAPNEYGDYEDSDTYGPFKDFDEAMDYLDHNFSNPGGFSEDDSGRAKVPRRSPNGRKVEAPRKDRWGSWR